MPLGRVKVHDLLHEPHRRLVVGVAITTGAIREHRGGAARQQRRNAFFMILCPSVSTSAVRILFCHRSASKCPERQRSRTPRRNAPGSDDPQLTALAHDRLGVCVRRATVPRTPPIDQRDRHRIQQDRRHVTSRVRARTSIAANSGRRPQIRPCRSAAAPTSSTGFPRDSLDGTAARPAARAASSQTDEQHHDARASSRRR